MTVQEILCLAQAGFSRDEIAKLSGAVTDGAAKPPETKQPDAPEDVKNKLNAIYGMSKQPDAPQEYTLADVQKDIADLTKTIAGMQASAAMTADAGSAGQATDAVADVIDYIINGGAKDGSQ